MMPIRIFSLFLMVSLLGCGPSRGKQAQEKLIEVLTIKDTGNYNLARLKLDSLINAYPSEMEVVREAERVMKEITVLEQKRNLVFLDSMLQVQQAALAPMMKNFFISDEYGPEKVFIHNRQKPENSYNRTFLRAHLNESGEFFLSSRYHGTDWIYHQQIKVYHQDQSVFTEVVPEDGFDNRRFEDQGAKWEIVNYKAEKDNGVTDYIASHWKDPLKVQFIGKRSVFVILESFDKEAIRDGYEISFVLKEIQKIKDEQKRVNQALRQIQ